MPKRISFDMLSDFDFSSVKNIITIKLINPSVRILQHIIAKFQSNTIKLKNTVSSLAIKIIARFDNNKINLINTVKSTLVAFFKGKENIIAFNNIAVSSLSLLLKAQTKLKLNTQITEKFILLLKAKNTLLIHNKADTKLQLVFKSKDNMLKIIKPKLAPMVEITMAKGLDNKINLKNSSNLQMVQKCTSEKNSIKIKTIATAYVYKPILLWTLYDDKIGDWYDRSIEDVFYGFEIE